jgi:hypothetical protein
MIRKIVFLIFVFISFAGENLGNHPGILNQVQNNGETSFQNNKNPSTTIDSLIIAFVREAHTYNHEHIFDSLASIAVSLAESTFDDRKMLKISLNYFKHVSIRGRFTDFVVLTERTEQLLLENDLNMDKFEFWLIISSAAAKLYFPDIAHKFALKALSESGYDKNPVKQVKAVLALGKSLEMQKFYIEAYQNFLEALFNVEKIENKSLKKSLKILTYDHLHDFHTVVRDFDHAAQYKI